MKYQALYNDKKFIIEDDVPEIGTYLYIFKDEICIKDYLQNNVKECKKFALREYGVPADAWQKVA